jgi:hypothetical protein
MGQGSPYRNYEEGAYYDGRELRELREKSKRDDAKITQLEAAIDNLKRIIFAMEANR